MARSSSVKVYLSTVTTEFQRGLRRAENMLAAFKKKIKGVSEALSSTMGMIGLGFGAAAIKSAIGDLDKMAKAARNLGVSAEYFQKMSFAADHSGVAVEKVFGAFARLKKGAAEASTGNKQMIEHFQRLGLSVEDLKKLSPEQLFDAVADRLKNMKDPLERDAVAAGLFGRSFAELNVYLKDYKDLGKELEARGGIISKEQLEAAEKFDDLMTNIQTTIKGMAFNSGFVEKLNWLVEKMDLLATGETDADRALAAKARDPNNHMISNTEVLRRAVEGDGSGVWEADKTFTEEEERAIARSGEAWAKVDSKGLMPDRSNAQQYADFQIIDAALNRLGFGAVAGRVDNETGLYFGGAKYMPDPQYKPEVKPASAPVESTKQVFPWEAVEWLKLYGKLSAEERKLLERQGERWGNLTWGKGVSGTQDAAELHQLAQIFQREGFTGFNPNMNGGEYIAFPDYRKSGLYQMGLPQWMVDADFDEQAKIDAYIASEEGADFDVMEKEQAAKFKKQEKIDAALKKSNDEKSLKRLENLVNNGADYRIFEAYYAKKNDFDPEDLNDAQRKEIKEMWDDLFWKKHFEEVDDQQKRSDEANAEISRRKKDAEIEALQRTDPLAAYLADFERQYGKLTPEQRDRLTKIWENNEADKAEAENALNSSTIGAWGGAGLDRQIGGLKLEERTAKATEETVKVLKKIENNSGEGLTYK